MLEERLDAGARVRGGFRSTRLRPEQVNDALAAAGSSPVRTTARAMDLLRRPEVKAKTLIRAADASLLADGMEDALVAVEVDIKYEGYVQRERDRAEALRARATFRIPQDLVYGDLFTLSHEAREKLGRVRPSTLAQASRVSGVSPADLQNLVLEIRKQSAGSRERFTGNMTVKQHHATSHVPRET